MRSGWHSPCQFNASKAFALALALLCVGLLNTSAAPPWQGQEVTNIITLPKLTDWTIGTHIGPPGGPLTNRVVYTNLPAVSGTDISVMLEAALANCPTNQSIRLPAGIFMVSNPPTMRPQVSVIGAGMNQTTNIGWSISAQSDNSSWAIYTHQVVVGGLTKGSTNLHVTNTTDFTVGRYALLARSVSTSQTENPIVVSVGGTNDASSYVYRFIPRIISKGSTNLIIWPPLVSDMSGEHARIMPLNLQKLHMGIEDMTLAVTGLQAGITWVGAKESWVHRVRIYGFSNRGIWLTECAAMDVSGNYIEGPSNSGANGAGMQIDTTSSSLVENNAVMNSFPCIEVNQGSLGNVFGYNFLLNTNGLYEFDANHGPHNAFNLYEGNLAPRFLSDGYFGGESDGILYRNWLHGIHPGATSIGYIIGLKRFTRNYSIVGNILGIGGSITMSYDGTSFGDPNLGNGNNNGNDAPPWADWGSWPGVSGFQEEDTNVLATTTRKLNYDFFTDSIPAEQADSNDLTDSLYRNGRPEFFPENYPYPPFNSANVNTSMDYTNNIFIPAQYAFHNGQWPSVGGGSSGTSAKTGNGRIKNKGPRGRFFQP